ncbi:MAG: DUF6789 family protein [Ferruginibacter sp.]
MNTKIQKSILAGLAGTAVMTLVTMVAPMMGMPKMNPAEMLAGLLGAPVFVGWLMHFMIGLIFAVSYNYIFSKLLNKIASPVAKGAVFGIIIFVFAQVMMMAMGAIMGGMPAPEGSKMLMMIGSLMGHIIFGIIVSLVSKENSVKAFV